MMGRPKYSDKDLQDIFNPKIYMVQLGTHFSSTLQKLQEKIDQLKK